MGDGMNMGGNMDMNGGQMFVQNNGGNNFQAF